MFLEIDTSLLQMFHKKTKAVSIRCIVYYALIFEVPSYRNLCSTWLCSHYGRNLIHDARIRVPVNPGSSITIYVAMCRLIKNDKRLLVT